MKSHGTCYICHGQAYYLPWDERLARVLFATLSALQLLSYQESARYLGVFAAQVKVTSMMDVIVQQRGPHQEATARGAVFNYIWQAHSDLSTLMYFVCSAPEDIIELNGRLRLKRGRYDLHWSVPYLGILVYCGQNISVNKIVEKLAIKGLCQSAKYVLNEYSNSHYIFFKHNPSCVTLVK